MSSEYESIGSGEREPRLLEFVIDDGTAEFKLGDGDNYEDLQFTLLYLGNSEERIQNMLDNVLRTGVNAMGWFNEAAIGVNVWNNLPDNVEVDTTISFGSEVSYDEALHTFVQIFGGEEQAKTNMRAVFVRLVDDGKLNGIRIRADINNPLLTDSEEDIAAEMATLSEQFQNEE